jgi:hypothetical protein
VHVNTVVIGLPQPDWGFEGVRDVHGESSVMMLELVDSTRLLHYMYLLVTTADIYYMHIHVVDASITRIY